MYKLKRQFRVFFNRVFNSLDRKDLVKRFRSLGLREGVTVCVHSSLSGLGYIKGGPDTVIDALIEVVGAEGCLAMPSFPMRGTMLGYLEKEGPFDVRNSPSKVGAITEIFRKRPGVLRSLHPTHSVAAWGAGAEALLRDHETSTGPYGRDTPYGRLADDPNAYMLLLGTRLLSLPHHLQERVEFPNLFLPDEVEATVIDREGNERVCRTRVMRPKVPYFVAIPPANGEEPDWCVLHDFCLMFPRARVDEVRELGYRFRGYEKLWHRREECERAGILRTARIGKGEVGLLRTKAFIELVEPELRTLLERYSACYDIERIAALDLPR